MLKLVGMALLAAMTMAFFAQPALSLPNEQESLADHQKEVQKLWEGSGYAHPGKGMRTMKMMHMMDTDNDGKVTKEQFMHYYEMVWDRMDPGHLGEIGVNKWIGQ